MDRVPAWVWLLAAVVLVALGIWSATDENWSGVIVSAALAVLCIVAWRSRSRSA